MSEHIASEHSGGVQTLARFLHGNVMHAGRRAEEMETAAEYIRDLGVEPTMSRAAAELHRRHRDRHRRWSSQRRIVESA